jgi:hypothetical protein
VTVRSWEEVLGGCSGPPRPGEVEWECWRRLLRGTNLGGRAIEWPSGPTPREVLRGVRECRPAWIPRALVGPLVASTTLTPSEEEEIRAQITRLASRPGTTLREVHPLVRLALNAERLAERLSIPWAQDVLSLPPRTYQGLALVVQVLDERAAADIPRNAALRDAQQAAGRRPG